MKKEDLKFGNVVEVESGSKLLFTFYRSGDCEYTHEFINLGVISSCSKDTRNYDHLNDDLIFDMNSYPFQPTKIMKIYKDYTLKEVLWERKEMPRLTKAEKAVLKALPDKFKYIVRDKIGDLELYGSTPTKNDYKQWWCSVDDDDEYASFDAYNHLFQFIKWEDEPYKISDLLEANK